MPSLRVRILETKGTFQRGPGICCGNSSWRLKPVDGRGAQGGLRCRGLQARTNQNGRKTPLRVTPSQTRGTFLVTKVSLTLTHPQLMLTVKQSRAP